MSEVELGVSAFWWVMAVGGLSGIASILLWGWALRHLANKGQVSAAGNAMMAHLMEFRLFADEPALILRAQRDLLRANARWLRLLLGPLVVTTLFFAAIVTVSDGFFGRAPLQPGQAAVVTAHFRGGLVEARIGTSAGFAVETQPVRLLSQHETSWRVRANGGAMGRLILTGDSLGVTRTIWGQRGLHWLPERKWFLTDRAVEWMEIRYAPTTVFGQHWLVWFSAGVCGGALASRIGVIRG